MISSGTDGVRDGYSVIIFFEATYLFQVCVINAGGCVWFTLAFATSQTYIFHKLAADTCEEKSSIKLYIL